MPVFYSEYIDLILCMLSCILLLPGMTAIGLSRERTFGRNLSSWLYIGIALITLATREWIAIIGISEPGFISFFPLAALMHTLTAIFILLAANREAKPNSLWTRTLHIVTGITCLTLIGLLLEPYANYHEYVFARKSLIKSSLFFFSKFTPLIASIILYACTVYRRKPPRTVRTVFIILLVHCLLIALSTPPGVPVRPDISSVYFNRLYTTLFILRGFTALVMGLLLWNIYARILGVVRQIRWWPISLLLLFLCFAVILSGATARNHQAIVVDNLEYSASNASRSFDPALLAEAAAKPGMVNNPAFAAQLFGHARELGYFQGYGPLRIVVDALALPVKEGGQAIPLVDIGATSDGGRWNPADGILQRYVDELLAGTVVHPGDRDTMQPLIVTSPIPGPDGTSPVGLGVMSVSSVDLARETFLFKRGLLIFLPPAFFIFLLLFSGLQRAWLASHSVNRSEAIRLGALGNDLTGVAITSGSTIVDCNQRFLNIMNMPRNEIIGSETRDIFDMVGENSHRKMNGIIMSKDPTETTSFEVTVRRKAGDLVDLLIFGRRLAGSDTDKPHHIWEVVDITRQKDMENQLRRSRDVLQMTLDTIPIGVFLKDGNGIYRMVNKAFYRLMQLEDDTEIIGRKTADFMPDAMVGDSQQDQIALDMQGTSLVYEHSFELHGILHHFEVSKTLNVQGERPDQQMLVGSIQDMTARKEAVEAIRAERHFLMQLINALPISMCFMDNDRIIRICDRDFAREAGVDKPEDLVGQPYDSIAPYGPIHFHEDDKILNHDQDVTDIDFELRKNGRRRNFIIRRIGIRDTNHNLLGLLKAFWDTTDLVAANHAAKKAERAKAAFLANMSHELRTPMNGIVGMSDLIIDDETTEPLQRLYAETIIKSAKTLQMVMDEVMDVATLDDAHLHIKLAVAPFPLLALAEEATNIVSCIIEAWGAQVTLSYDYTLHTVYLGDARRIRQILVQILTHCSRITRDKRLRLEILRAGEEDDNRVAFRVSFAKASDISALEIEGMFKRPTRSKSETAYNIGMFDDRIGLPLAWRLIDAMQGKLDIVSDGEIVTCETVIPLAPDPKGAQQVQTPESLHGLDVIIARTKNEDNARSASSCLAYAGCTILRADTREEVEHLLRDTASSGRKRPVLLLDSGLVPDSKLESYLSEIGEEKVYRDSDILLLISSRQVQNMQNLPLNIKCLVLPPICPSDLWYKTDAVLQARVAEGLKTDKDGKKSPSSRVILRRPSDRLSRQVRVDAEALLVEDNTVNQMVAMGILKRIGCKPSLAKNGKEALDLITSGRKYDFILMDCMMPVMDGYEATSRIRLYERDNPAVRNTIIALTANNVAGDREKCLASGMDGYIAKPITLEILRDSIGRLRPDLVTIVDEIT